MNDRRCDYCGSLEWTIYRYNQQRVLHKHSCPHRRDRYCQSHPNGCLPIKGAEK